MLKFFLDVCCVFKIHVTWFKFIKKRSSPQQTNDSRDINQSYRSITTTDLLCWSFQTTRAMQHLVSHKILHANLCAENIMLCEDNVVKICNFGLPQSMYQSGIGKNRVRKKQIISLFQWQTKSSLCFISKFYVQSCDQFKWMALETLRDQVYSIYSDGYENILQFDLVSKHLTFQF